MKIGVGYRRELAGWIDSQPVGVTCLEITAEHFPAEEEARLTALSSRYELYVHGLGLSLGTPGCLDAKRLARFARVAKTANARWVSEHIAFTRTAEVDLGHLNPIQPTRANVRLIAAHAREIAERCARPLLLENITSHLRLEGELAETDFLNAICAEADCGLLLDVTNLFINSRNHRFDPLAWLDQLDASRIVQLHLVGYAEEHGRFADDHAHAVQPELLELAREVITRAPVQAMILERDEAFPDGALMDAEVDKLTGLCARD